MNFNKIPKTARDESSVTIKPHWTRPLRLFPLVDFPSETLYFSMLCAQGYLTSILLVLDENFSAKRDSFPKLWTREKDPLLKIVSFSSDLCKTKTLTCSLSQMKGDFCKTITVINLL